MVRDADAALGETGTPCPCGHRIERFEKHGFIKRIEGDRIEFDYSGRQKQRIDAIRPADARRGAQRMTRLTNAQRHDPFWATNSPPDVADRDITRIGAKAEDGLTWCARNGGDAR